jgi:KUP system potassium uptake protein
MMLPLLALDIIFLGANSLKVFEGGYVPLALGALIILVMWTWRRGSQILFAKTRKTEVPLVDLVKSLSKRPPHQVPGTAVFFTSDPDSTPTALLHSLKHYKVLHENNVVLTVRTSNSPSVAPEDRVKIEKLNDLFSRLIISYGYMETPDVPKALGLARKLGWKFNIMTTSFFLSRRSVRVSKHEGMPVWQDTLFIGLARNANDASSYFRLPTDRVVEVGSQITV